MSTWFPQRWPIEDPDVIQLYTMNTQNGQKVSICLEEMELPYEAHTVNITKGDQFDPDLVRINPNGKIPVLIDPHGPEDEAVYMMESIVILQYLADKTGRFFPKTYRARLEAQQWLLFQAAHIGPMFGQLGHFFKFAKGKTSDTYAETRYLNETKRLLAVLEKRLTDREFLVGDYSIVDMATAPWVEGLVDFYGAGEALALDSLPQLNAWRKRVTARPAYQRGRYVGALR